MVEDLAWRRLPTGDCRPRRVQQISGRVRAVVDGDTIKVRAYGARRRFYTVRIIGIDTPETHKPATPIQCGGPQATSYMPRLAMPGGRARRVWLTTDPTPGPL
jgi:micrococcal nuclease